MFIVAPPQKTASRDQTRDRDKTPQKSDCFSRYRGRFSDTFMDTQFRFATERSVKVAQKPTPNVSSRLRK